MPDTHDERGGDADPYDWDPVYAATAIDRLQKQLAAATARVEKAEALAAMNADLLAVVEHFLSAYVEDPDDTVIEAVGSRVLTVGNVRDIVAVLRGAAPDGRSEPVERSETSGGIGTASNSRAGTAGLPEACGNKYSYHVCFLPAGHDGDHRDDRYWRWPTHLGTWTNDDTTEDGQHG